MKDEQSIKLSRIPDQSRDSKGKFKPGYISPFRKYKICQICGEKYYGMKRGGRGHGKFFCSRKCQALAQKKKRFEPFIKNRYFYYHYGTKKVKVLDMINAYKQFSLRNMQEKFRIDCKTIKKLLILSQIDIKNRGAQAGSRNSVFAAIKNKNWKNPMSSPCFSIRPTKPEIQFKHICDKYDLPFRYTGNGKFWIEGINPDFVDSDGKKVIVEIFGDYWHDPNKRKISYKATEKGRKALLKKYGWECAIVWESEIKEEDIILKKLRKYGY